MKTVIVIQARMGSTRLPGKVLMPLGDDPVLYWAWVAACHASFGIPDCEVVIATSTLSTDDEIAEFAEPLGNTRVIRGSETDVLARFVQVAEETNADVLVRLTGDCPFHDPQVIREVIKLREITGSDYASNVDPPTYPDGLDVEVFTRTALMAAHKEATRSSDRDCVTRFISRNRYQFKAANLVCPLPKLDRERWVLDTEEDYKFCQEIATRIKSYPPSYLDILAILEKEPELRTINGHLKRNERFYDALTSEQQAERHCPTSTVLRVDAERLIPLGAQTFSKSKLQYPQDAPFMVTHGDGAYVYDVDGNDYVDLVSGLLPNILGYRDPDVDYAIRDQLTRGISFSMSTTLEAELATRLGAYIPCAEMCRFGKTGTDVTTAAVRLVRAYTNRRFVLKVRTGYHGWADWSVHDDNIRNAGVRGQPTVSAQKEEIIGMIERGEYAAVIVEPESDPKFLKELRAVCKPDNFVKDAYGDPVHQPGTILIFDEIITGFRFGMGGAQKYYGVTPDLACFGKAMANGMPISALVGKREIMQLMEKVCFSGTFFGEALSLAASIATIDKLDRCDVPQYLTKIGNILWNRANALIEKHNLGDYMSLRAGHPSLVRIDFTEIGNRTLFVQEMIRQGVLIIASHNVNFAMREPEIEKITRAYDHALAVVRQAITEGTVDERNAGNLMSPTVRELAS